MKKTNSTRKQVEEIIKQHRFHDFRWIPPEQIVVSQWVRMKCLYGCDFYGQNAMCPPHVPTVAECQQFFNEYKEAVIFHFTKKEQVPGDRKVWSKQTDKKLLELERAVFLAGYQKAFMLTVDQCQLCTECTQDPQTCKHAKLARPTIEAFAVDVFTTARNVGYTIHVLTDPTDTMNRYALLLVE
jgi:predicted metal-binding protein